MEKVNLRDLLIKLSTKKIRLKKGDPLEKKISETIHLRHGMRRFSKALRGRLRNFFGISKIISKEDFARTLYSDLGLVGSFKQAEEIVSCLGGQWEIVGIKNKKYEDYEQIDIEEISPSKSKEKFYKISGGKYTNSVGIGLPHS